MVNVLKNKSVLWSPVEERLMTDSLQKKQINEHEKVFRNQRQPGYSALCSSETRSPPWALKCIHVKSLARGGLQGSWLLLLLTLVCPS